MSGEGQSQYHSQVLADINNYISRNSFPPQQWMEAVRFVAQQHGYIINVPGILAPGIGVDAQSRVMSGPASNGLQNNYNFSSEIVNPQRSGVKLSGEITAESFEVMLTGYGKFSYERKTQVDGAQLDILAKAVGGGSILMLMRTKVV